MKRVNGLRARAGVAAVVTAEEAVGDAEGEAAVAGAVVVTAAGAGTIQHPR